LLRKTLELFGGENVLATERLRRCHLPADWIKRQPLISI
jgi:hypothetical protein